MITLEDWDGNSIQHTVNNYKISNEADKYAYTQHFSRKKYNYTFIKIIKNLYTYILTILAEKIQYKYQTIAVFMMFTFISVGHMKISAKDYD